MYKISRKLFPDRCREIPAIDGGILLQQIRVSKHSYLHRFLKPEPAGIFHVHRWLYMRSFVLWGNYTEERLFADRTTRKIRHRWLSTFSMTKDVVHRIDQWNSAWTWCFVKSDTGLWGYLDSDLKYTPWDEYIPQDKRVGQI